MKPAYLVAYGANQVEIICMLFVSFNAGMQWLEDNSEWTWDFHHSIPDKSRWATPIIPEECLDESIASHEKFFNKIFISWYFGCGEVDSVRLIELDEYAEPLVPFDLD